MIGFVVSFLVIVNGAQWNCQHDQGLEWYACFERESGEIYAGSMPLSAASLANYHAQQERDNAEAACVCSREIHGGVNSGNGIICTGAFDPYLLRKREADPCAGAWEKSSNEHATPP